MSSPYQLSWMPAEWVPGGGSQYATLSVKGRAIATLYVYQTTTAPRQSQSRVCLGNIVEEGPPMRSMKDAKKWAEKTLLDFLIGGLDVYGYELELEPEEEI